MVTAQEDKTRAVTVWLTPAMIEKLRKEQRRTGIPVSTQIRVLLHERYPEVGADE